ncbi:thioredoxin [Candidatus Dojkabacteria bacterium]|uniref:Thioredoxin n=1 Tax=Candidatus Dojkabacteria bacterium TaxID=2099670 RepID=A0A955RJ62_9BACT|nr:thioredoxin [Candidatus Dojkabacteria bacterium]
MAQAVTDNDFQKEVLEFEGVVLVDFWAEWCGPCKALEPAMESLTEKYSGNNAVKLLKLDVDENPQTQSNYQVLSIPTMILFKNGEVINTIVGLKPEEVIEQEIESALNS